MATYSSLTNQIAKLQAQADRLKVRESKDVIAKIKKAIAHYGLTAADLGFAGGVPTGKRASGKTGARAGKSVKRKSERPIKYADGLGNTWVGYGKPPVWFQAALKAGRTKDELLVKGSANGPAPQGSASSAAPAPAKAAAGVKKKATSKGARNGAAKKGTGKKAGVVRYRDDQGNTWSGFGPQTRWFKAALASGKSLTDLAA